MSHAFPDRSFQSPSPRRSTIDIEEQRAWVGFYRRVGRDVALAAEVMAQLDGDAEMKRRHLALYLSCKQSLRVHKARQARDKRIGQWLRLLVQWTLQRPAPHRRPRQRHRSGARALPRAVTSTAGPNRPPRRCVSCWAMPSSPTRTPASSTRPACPRRRRSVAPKAAPSVPRNLPSTAPHPPSRSAGADPKTEPRRSPIGCTGFDR